MLRFQFTANGRETLVPKREPAKNRQLMGQRDHLSTEDVNILKKIYCGGKTSRRNLLYEF